MCNTSRHNDDVRLVFSRNTSTMRSANFRVDNNKIETGN
jgi:hypothetical protein